MKARGLKDEYENLVNNICSIKEAINEGKVETPSEIANALDATFIYFCDKNFVYNMGNNDQYDYDVEAKLDDYEDTDGYKSKHGMPSNQGLVDICKTFLLEIEEAEYYASLYASISWLNNQLNSSELDRFDKWVRAVEHVLLAQEAVRNLAIHGQRQG